MGEQEMENGMEKQRTGEWRMGEQGNGGGGRESVVNTYMHTLFYSDNWFNMLWIITVNPHFVNFLTVKS